MTPPYTLPLGTLICSGKPYAHRVTPAWIAKRLRRHAGAPARIKAREFNNKQRQLVHNVA